MFCVKLKRLSRENGNARVGRQPCRTTTLSRLTMIDLNGQRRVGSRLVWYPSTAFLQPKGILIGAYNVGPEPTQLV
jgi:hypothetical protein